MQTHVLYVFKILVLIPAVLLPAPRAYADLITCVRATSNSTLSCRASGRAAKAEADATTASYQRRVTGKSVRETADMMAEATEKIQAIYQSADQACQNHVASCKRDCADPDESDLASACEQEITKVTSQVGAGRKGNEDGYKDARNSSSAASADQGLKEKTKEQKSKFAQGTGGGGPSANAITNPSSKDESARTRGGANQSVDPQSNVNSAFAKAFGANTEVDPDQSAATDLKKAVAVFCADPASAACPSCGGGQDLAKSCNQRCMADPVRGPELGDLCRQVVARSMTAAMSAGAGSGFAAAGGDGDGAFSRAKASPARRPATADAILNAAGVNAAIGPALFVIHSRAITAKCRRWNLKTCAK